MLITFREALKKLNAVDRANVESKLGLLAKTSLGGQAVSNFHNEELMGAKEWAAVFSGILKANVTGPGVPGEAIQEAIREVLRGRVLRGKRATCPPRTIFGRAVTATQLANTFHALGYFASPASALCHINTVARKSLVFIRKRWRTFELGRYVMWSAFDPTGMTPFHALPRTATDVSAILGMDDNVKGQPLLVLYYALPKSCTPYIPRVAEAYASDPWVYYFRPALPADRQSGHGRTFVWASHASQHDGLPEVVHKPITGDSLLNQVEEWK